MSKPQDYDENFIPLDVAKRIIMSTLEDFDTILGARAREIFANGHRLRITEELEQRTGMMNCLPAGITIQDLKDRDMYFDFVEPFDNGIFIEHNADGSEAIINFEYTYSADSLCYLAHEIGHAIADDIQRACGLSFRDFSPHELEKQAYFIQSIVAAHIDPDFNTESAAFVPASETSLSSAFNREAQRYEAVGAYKQAAALAASQRTAFIETIMGKPACAATITPPYPLAEDTVHL